MDTPTKVAAAAAAFYVAEMSIVGFGVFRGDAFVLGFVLLTTAVMAPSGFYFTRHKARAYLSEDRSRVHRSENGSRRPLSGDD